MRFKTFFANELGIYIPQNCHLQIASAGVIFG